MNLAKYLVWMVIILNILDGITAKRILIGEINPVYLLSKSYLLLMALKIVFCFLIYYLYTLLKKPKIKNVTKFIICMYFVYALAGLGLGFYSNITAPQEQLEELTIHQEQLEQEGNYEQIQIEDQQKISVYTNFALISFFYPFIMSLLSFLLYESSRKYLISHTIS